MTAASHWSLAWAHRPTEEASNFNPAFCGELLCRSVGEYHKVRSRPFNVALAFLVLPLALHKATRDGLPGRSNVAFAGWVAEHSTLIAELALRVERLRPVVRESMMFAIRQQRLAFDEGGLIPGAKKLSATAKADLTTADADEARSAAGLLGRWFSGQARTPAILQGFGVGP
ncbi:three component ABC system middle component [Mesorhizobium sp.]|uniref:three component ABC system middle component n=1 Tax=Mesorhizobium sp. TaxID=1871066 RepID=UPI000FE6F5EF|nr:three component ABC system middle component [Mesorhizobium sp.]RWP54349.1 MAG: hypothetical protein EOR06_10815 [Mesorhizobium sp.]